jgi:hypothetical protein
VSNVHRDLAEIVVEGSVTSFGNYITATRKSLFAFGIRKPTLEFWKSKLNRKPTDSQSFYYNILADMAMRLLTAGTSEACVERVFSYLVRMQTAERTQMLIETLFYRLINGLYGEL